MLSNSTLPAVKLAFEKLNVNYALLLTWNYLEFFLDNSSFIKSGGKFIVPFPKPEIFPK